MLVKLKMVNSKQAGTTYIVHKSPYVIGRHDGCDLRVKSPRVSLHHCAILVKENEVWVRDLKSTNGTFVNDRQVTADYRLKPGDLIQAGPAVMEVIQEAAGLLQKDDREQYGSTIMDASPVAGPRTDAVPQAGVTRRPAPGPQRPGKP